MKKNKLSLIAVLTLATAITFNSCEKIEEGSPITVNTSKTATISGMVHADLVLDKTHIMSDEDPFDGFPFYTINDTLEYAPAGTEIHFHVKKQDFNSGVIDENDEFRYSTTVNANGTYSISIPTNEEGLNVDISFDDFEYNKLTWEYSGFSVGFLGDTTLNYTSSSEREVYSSADATVFVHENEDVILDFNY